MKGLIVGVGPCQSMFENIPGVVVKGWLSGLDLAEAYASSDILLFPSDVETFGNVTLEVWAIFAADCASGVPTFNCVPASQTTVSIMHHTAARLPSPLPLPTHQNTNRLWDQESPLL